MSPDGYALFIIFFSYRTYYSWIDDPSKVARDVVQLQVLIVT